MDVYKRKANFSVFGGEFVNLFVYTLTEGNILFVKKDCNLAIKACEKFYIPYIYDGNFVKKVVRMKNGLHFLQVGLGLVRWRLVVGHLSKLIISQGNWPPSPCCTSFSHTLDLKKSHKQNDISLG